MTDDAYEHVSALDDPARPWRKIWRCTATGFYVKTHARREQGGLGVVSFVVTASACDAQGLALRRSDNSAAVLGSEAEPQRHLLSVFPDAAEAEPIGDLLQREVLLMVARVERALLNEQQAAAL